MRTRVYPLALILTVPICSTFSLDIKDLIWAIIQSVDSGVRVFVPAGIAVLTPET
jgi:hypothetical protein